MRGTKGRRGGVGEGGQETQKCRKRNAERRGKEETRRGRTQGRMQMNKKRGEGGKTKEAKKQSPAVRHANLSKV